MVETEEEVVPEECFRRDISPSCQSFFFTGEKESLIEKIRVRFCRREFFFSLFVFRGYVLMLFFSLYILVSTLSILFLSLNLFLLVFAIVFPWKSVRRGPCTFSLPSLGLLFSTSALPTEMFVNLFCVDLLVGCSLREGYKESEIISNSFQKNWTRKKGKNQRKERNKERKNCNSYE